MRSETVISDEELAASAEEQDLEQLYDRFSWLLLVIFVPCGADAEDMLHSTWLQVLRNLPKKFPEGKFRGWLVTVARNLLRDWLKRNRHTRLNDEPEPVDPAPSPLVRLLDRERIERLSSCLDKLRERQPVYSNIIIALLKGQTVEEICSAFKVDPQQVYNAKNKSIPILQECVRGVANV